MGDSVCDPTKETCVSEKEPYPDQPPRLLVAINRYGDKQNINRTPKPRKVPRDPQGGDAVLCPAGAIYVGEILDWVAKGLEPSEMALAWATDAGKHGEIGPGVSSGEQALERDWAKLVSEMFVPNGYDLPDNMAGWSLPGSGQARLFNWVDTGLQKFQAQTYIYQRLQLEYVPQAKWGKDAARPTAAREKNDDPAYSLVTECQQFSTYILISRGFLIERDMASCGVTAGAGSRGCQMFDRTEVRSESSEDGVAECTTTKHEGNWAPWDKDPKFNEAKHAIADLGLTPGSIYVFDRNMGRDTSKQGDGSHVWPIIRIDSKNARFQNLDWGATTDTLPTPPWVTPVKPVPADLAMAGTAGGWLTRGYPPGDACGLGIAPKADRLADAVQHLRRARPVGLARLAIQRWTAPKADQAPKAFNLMYLSSFVRMWGDSAEDNYAPARFLLSLRNTPYFEGADVSGDKIEGIRAYWFLYAPRSYLAYVMWSKINRRLRPSDFFVEALRYESAYGPPGAQTRTHFNTGDLQCVIVLTHDEMGFAKVEWRHDARKTTTKQVKDAAGNSKTMTVAQTPMVDGMDPNFFGGPTGDGLLPGLGVRWDGEYFDPSIAPGGRHAPPFFDFEQVFVPEGGR